ETRTDAHQQGSDRPSGRGCGENHRRHQRSHRWRYDTSARRMHPARRQARLEEGRMTVSHQEYPDIVGMAPDVPEAAAFEPYIPAERALRELTPLPVVMGTILGMIFGASSLYLVLKVGLTVSASIPVAVIAIALFRLASKAGVRDSTILENNIVQTAGSAGESIAFGLGVTMPAILILGFDLEIT